VSLKQTTLETLIGHDETRLRRAAAKLTHVGEQTESVATIIMQTYYYLPTLSMFSALHTTGLSYVNDELPLILNFATTLEEFRRMLAAVAQTTAATQASNLSPSLSFAVVIAAPEGVEGTELLFDYSNGVALHRALSDALGPTNTVGQTVLKLQRSAAYDMGAG
jgi:hypothetical protein